MASAQTPLNCPDVTQLRLGNGADSHPRDKPLCYRDVSACMTTQYRLPQLPILQSSKTRIFLETLYNPSPCLSQKIQEPALCTDTTMLFTGTPNNSGQPDLAHRSQSCFHILQSPSAASPKMLRPEITAGHLPSERACHHRGGI